MKKFCCKSTKIKAAGGISSFEDAQKQGVEFFKFLGAVLAVMTGLLVFFLPPQQLLSGRPQTYQSYAALAHDFYTQEIDGLLTEEDAGRHALLIESTAEALEITSRSGKTHAYQYFALPVRVEEPAYLIYGDYDQLDFVDEAFWHSLLIKGRCELLILRVEDELYWEDVRDALGLYGDNDGPVGVYDVAYENGVFTFTMREAPVS